MKNRLREFRKARGLTLEQVAEAVGTSHQQVQRLETGARRLTLEWLTRLAAAMEYEPADLIGRHKPEHIALLRLIAGLNEQQTKVIMGAVRGVLGDAAHPHPAKRTRQRVND